MGRTAESDSVSDARASLGKSTSSSQVGAAFLDAVAAVDMFKNDTALQCSRCVGSTRARR